MRGSSRSDGRSDVRSPTSIEITEFPHRVPVDFDDQRFEFGRDRVAPVAWRTYPSAVTSCDPISRWRFRIDDRSIEEFGQGGYRRSVIDHHLFVSEKKGSRSIPGMPRLDVGAPGPESMVPPNQRLERDRTTVEVIEGCDGPSRISHDVDRRLLSRSELVGLQEREVALRQVGPTVEMPFDMSRGLGDLDLIAEVIGIDACRSLAEAFPQNRAEMGVATSRIGREQDRFGRHTHPRD